jgi:hypothetical protein
VSSNFSISTEETSSFYAGFLKPIDLTTLNYFIRQGYPLEMLFWLFADSFELQRGSKPSYALSNAYRYDYNPPDSYGCPRHDPSHRCFREWIWIALLAGLTVEEKTVVTKFTSKYDTNTVARFCFSRQLAQKAANEMPKGFAEYIAKKYMKNFTAPKPICGDWPDKEAEALLTNPQSDNFNFTVSAGLTFRVVPRSAYGVFEFLGNLIRIKRYDIPPTNEKAFLWEPPYGPPFGEPDEKDVPPQLKTVDDNPPLITITAPGDNPCFVHTWYLDSDFCVSDADTNTKRILSLLAQLIAIQTQATDLSITPLVRVIQ